MKNNPTSTEPNEASQLIERISEELLSPEQRRRFGGVAVSVETPASNTQPIPLENGKFGRGIVPVETPGPTAYNQASANGTLPPGVTIRR